jgi:uncharacterized protein YjbI with pentapeptide repeats
MRDLIRRAAGMAVAAAGAGVLAAGLMTAAPGTAAAATTLTAAGAVLPAGVVLDPGSSPAVSLASVSCASAGNCTAVGEYDESSGDSQGLLLTETAGTWAAGVEAPLPAGAAANPEVNLASLSCASAGNCTAVGSYTDSSGGTQALALTETAGTWAAGVEAPLPAGAAANPEASLFSVSCPSPGNCAAGGSYVDNSGPTVDSSGHTQVVLLTETAGTWAAAEAAPPAGGLANPFFPLLTMGVSCASAGNCTAVASYNLGTNNVQPVVLTETAGTWAAGVQVPTPAGSTFGRLFSVSCASAGECTAVGYYGDISSNSWHGLLVSQTSAQPTTTALASSASPSAAGHPVTYTATVSPPPDGGTAAFTDNGTPITGCTAQPVSTSTGRATCQTTPSSAGAHNITAAFSGTGSFTASTSATLTQVVTKAACPSLAGCNLSGLNLTNAQLPGANLTGANLNGTSLAGANLASANLTGANLNGASVAGANLASANLTGANLNGANLTGANLAGANLAGANLNKANLTGANLAGANLVGANINKVTWSNTTCPDGTNSNADGGTCTAHL